MFHFMLAVSLRTGDVYALRYIRIASAAAAQAGCQTFLSLLAMAPSAAELALEAEFAIKHGRYALSKPLIRDKLIAYWSGRGETLVDLPLDVDNDDVTSWEGEWKAMAASAGVADAVDQNRLIGWLKARANPAVGSGGTHSESLASRVMTSLEAAGRAGERSEGHRGRG